MNRASIGVSVTLCTDGIFDHDIIVANVPILFQTSDVLPSNFENVAAGALKGG